MHFPDFYYEIEFKKEFSFLHVAGVDEAGRGPLAGPVVAAAVILPDPDLFSLKGISDSKKMTPKKREEMYLQIYKYALSIGIGIVDADEIDKINILQASLLAMSFAVDNLEPSPCGLLIDGKFKIKSDIKQKAIIKGDTLSISIAAASIIAKVTRDRLMKIYDRQYPEYGFLNHKGYPTKKHKQAIKTYGISPIHRKTFKGVKEYVE